ncbi:MAG: amino acid ABC transporter permease [Bacillota bacterium]|nr:amino acid ABC transporter permease [Bacillota bacterium]
MHSWNIMVHAFPQLLHGLGRTVEFSLIAIFLASIIGLITALFKLSRFQILRVFSWLYVEIFRGTPLLVQLIFIALGLPTVLPLNKWFGSDNYPFIAAAIGLALNEGAYITEIIRAGILSVDRGQREAAHSIGMTRLQSMVYIILPQAFKRMIPPLVNQFAQTIKDTSLLAPIAIVELLYTGQIIVAENFAGFQIYGEVAILYLVIIFTLTRFAGYLERRLQIDKR